MSQIGANINNNIKKKRITKYLQRRALNQSKKKTIFTYDDESDIFLGSLEKYNITDKKFSPITEIGQKPYTISVNDEACPDNGCTSVTIDQCDIAKVRDKTKEMLKNIIKCPNDMETVIYQVNSINELEMKAGISIQAGPLFKFLTSIGLESQRYNTNVIIIITIQHLQIDVSYINEFGPYNIINDDVSLEDIKNSIDDDEIPLFTSSIIYGKQMVFSIQTNLTYDKLESNLGIKGYNIFDLSAFIVKMNAIKDINAHLFIRGYQNELTFNIDTSNINDIINSLPQNDGCFGKPIYYKLSNLSNNKRFGFPEINDENKKIHVNVLHVIPDSKFKVGTDFSSLEKHKKKKFLIIISQMKESNFVSLLNTKPNYLSKIHILMLGGFDGSRNYSKFNEKIVTMINNWRLNKGFVLFLHDFIAGDRAILFKKIADDLGFDGINKKKQIFNEVEVCTDSDSLCSDPNPLSNLLSISDTHESAKYNQNYIKIRALGNPNLHYYCENLDSGVADCSIGHSKTISSEEQRLFINIIRRIAANLFGFPYGTQRTNGSTQGNENQNTNNINTISQSTESPLQSSDENISEFSDSSDINNEIEKNCESDNKKPIKNKTSLDFNV